MKITRQFILHNSNGGSPNNKQLAALGIGLKWPLPSGWLQFLVGRHISDDQARNFIAARIKRKQKQHYAKPKADFGAVFVTNPTGRTVFDDEGLPWE